MSRRAQLPDGTILEFPDNTPDSVMDMRVKEHLKAAFAPSRGTVTVEQAKKAFAANPNPFGVADTRSTGQVVKDSAVNDLEGVGQSVAGIPGIAKEGAAMFSDAFNPAGGAHRNIQRFQNMGTGIKDTIGPLLSDADLLNRSLFHDVTNRILGRPPVGGVQGTPSDPEQQRGYQNFAGQNLGGILLPELVGGVRQFPSNLRTALNEFTSPEARMGAANTTRANIAKSLSLPASTNTMALLRTGANLARRGSIPINEALAKFIAGDRPYGINARTPIFGGEEPTMAIARGQSEETLALKNAMERQRQTSLAKIEQETRMAPNQMNRTAPSGAATADQAIITQEKLGIKPPPQTHGLTRAIEEYQAKPPVVVDGPSVNKWIGTKLDDMRYDFDPGALLVEEGLVGADKAATLQKAIPVLDKAGSDLGAALKSADKTGKTINLQDIINTEVAETTKPFSKGTDEAFMKQVEQLGTDALNSVEDLANVKPTDAHRIKVALKDQINWKTKDYIPINEFRKSVYGRINKAIGEIDTNIKTMQRRWGGLDKAIKLLQDSMRNDLRGRGTGPDPLAVAIKNQGKK